MRAMRIVSCLACAALAREEPASPGLEGRRIEEPPWLAPNNTDAFVFGKHVERSLAKRRAAYRDAVLAGPATVAADVRAALAAPRTGRAAAPARAPPPPGSPR